MSRYKTRESFIVAVTEEANSGNVNVNFVSELACTYWLLTSM